MGTDLYGAGCCPYVPVNAVLHTKGPNQFALVAFLPYIFDHPVEHATDKAFDWVSEQMIRENERKAKKDL